MPCLEPLIRRCLAAWLLVVLVCLGGAPAQAQDPAPTQAPRTLVVGSEQDYPPFAVGMTDDTAGGFTVELWRSVAKAQGLDYTIRVRPFDELLQAFKAGKVDVLLNLAKSDARREFADFSATHVVVGGAVFVRQGDRRIKAEDDLAARSLIVLKGDLAHDYAISKGWQPGLVLVDTAAQGLRLLAAGQHDAMLISALTGTQTMRQLGITGVEALGVKVGVSQRFAFATRKGDTELLFRLNEGLAIAKADGTYDRLYETWFGPYEPRSPGWRQIRLALGAAAALAVIGLAAFYLNRRARDRQTAAILRDSEERWKFALDGAGDGVWDANLLSGTTLYSKRWKEILGYREDEISNASDEWLRRIHPDDVARVLRENEACIKGTADSFVSEFRMQTKDGRWIWLLDRGKVIDRAPDGRARRMIGTHSDITARKVGEAREAARAHVMMQIATGNALPAILASITQDVESRSDWLCSILLVDDGGTRLSTGAAPSLSGYFNAAIDRLLASATDEPGRAQLHGSARVVCEDLRLDPRWAALRLVAEPAELHAFWSEPILAADGTLLGTLANYRNRPGGPRASEIEIVVDAAQVASIAIERRRSMAALRASEAMLQQKSRTLEVTLERMEQGVMMVNPERIVEVCNRKAIELLDLPAELMAARPHFTEVLAFQWASDEFAHTPHDLQAFVRAGGILDRPQRYERLRPNGRTIEVHSVPISGGGVLRTYTDITERKQAELTRLALEGQLLEARKLEAIGTLAGGIAHDFNNIMAAILGNAALAQQDIGPGHPAQAFLDQIGKAGRRARSLVQQILTFSRQQPNEFVSVALRPLVEETVALLRSMAGTSAQWRAILPDTDLAVMGNPTQLQQVLMNLGTNAWHALRDGVGQVDIGLEVSHLTEGDAGARPATLAPGTYAHLWVSDDGLGMDAQTLQRIYEPFFTTRPVGTGTGLGLAVVHGIIKALGGAIGVVSTPGEGTRFDLYLPLVDHTSPDTAPAPLQPEPGRGHGEHVVYIDDDEVMGLMVTGLLQRQGYRVTSFLAAREAIETLTHGPDDVDLVVTDFNMPTVSGLDVVRALARVRPGLPVVISSGYVSDELRADAAAMGVRAVMQKEHTLEELAGLVHEALAAGRRTGVAPP